MTIHHARLMRLALLGAAFFLFLLLPGDRARALTVSPVLFDMDIAPGASAQAKIVLTNETDEPQTFSFLAENFIASGEEGAQTYIHEEELTGLASWVYPDRPEVSLDPGKSADFPFLIRVPEDAEPGGHYAAIFFSRGSGDGAPSAKGGVGITEQVGVLLLVRVPGNIMEQSNVESFRMARGAVLHRLPAEFELRVRNTGSVHVRPTGTLVIRNMIGMTVARLPANPKQSAVLPGSVRKIAKDGSAGGRFLGRGRERMEELRPGEIHGFGRARVRVAAGADPEPGRSFLGHSLEDSAFGARRFHGVRHSRQDL
jgi:hypothetical protein